MIWKWVALYAVVAPKWYSVLGLEECDWSLIVFFFAIAVVSEAEGHLEDNTNQTPSQENLKGEKNKASTDSLADKSPKR